MLPTAALDYDLPEDLIATRPVEPRDAARLMVVSRTGREPSRHMVVRDLPDILSPGDLLVRNRSRVIPARFRAVRIDSGGHAEGLFLAPAPAPGPADPAVWTILIKSRRQAAGVRFRLLEHDLGPSPFTLTLLDRHPDEPGAWIARADTDVPGDPISDAAAILDRLGLTPLPPYILASRKRHDVAVADAIDRDRYQTVYADDAGSVAAPTAGLHFTPELLGRLGARGVLTADTLLHVGTGTFKPIETEFVEQHPMHEEWIDVPSETGQAINNARSRGARVVAVGTTTLRAVESFESAAALARGGSRLTNLLITPGRPIRHTDALLTNFHLPRSTLLALVAAFFWTGGEEPPARAVGRLLDLYREAIDRGYRFYSFGDAMLILP